MHGRQRWRFHATTASFSLVAGRWRLATNLYPATQRLDGDGVGGLNLARSTRWWVEADFVVVRLDNSIFDVDDSFCYSMWMIQFVLLCQMIWGYMDLFFYICQMILGGNYKQLEASIGLMRANASNLFFFPCVHLKGVYCRTGNNGLNHWYRLCGADWKIRHSSVVLNWQLLAFM